MGSPPKLSRECEWSNASGQIQNKPAFLRINASLEGIAPVTGLDHLAAVSIWFKKTNPEGLPSDPQDLQAVDAIEDLLVDALEGENSVLSLALTHDGCRELYFYTGSPQAVIEVWEKTLIPQLKSHEVEINIEPDPEWQAFNAYTNH